MMQGYVLDDCNDNLGVNHLTQRYLCRNTDAIDCVKACVREVIENDYDKVVSGFVLNESNLIVATFNLVKEGGVTHWLISVPAHRKFLSLDEKTFKVTELDPV